jgi:hypothetical protein
MVVLLVFLGTGLLNIVLRIVVAQLVTSKGEKLTLTVVPREALGADVHVRVSLVLREVLLMEESNTGPSENGNSADDGSLLPNTHTG